MEKHCFRESSQFSAIHCVTSFISCTVLVPWSYLKLSSGPYFQPAFKETKIMDSIAAYQSVYRLCSSSLLQSISWVSRLLNISICGQKCLFYCNMYVWCVVWVRLFCFIRYHRGWLTVSETQLLLYTERIFLDAFYYRSLELLYITRSTCLCSNSHT